MQRPERNNVRRTSGIGRRELAGLEIVPQIARRAPAESRFGTVAARVLHESHGAFEAFGHFPREQSRCDGVCGVADEEQRVARVGLPRPGEAIYGGKRVVDAVHAHGA